MHQTQLGQAALKQGPGKHSPGYLQLYLVTCYTYGQLYRRKNRTDSYLDVQVIDFLHTLLRNSQSCGRAPMHLQLHSWRVYRDQLTRQGEFEVSEVIGSQVTVVFILKPVIGLQSLGSTAPTWCHQAAAVEHSAVVLIDQAKHPYRLKRSRR